MIQLCEHPIRALDWTFDKHICFSVQWELFKLSNDSLIFDILHYIIYIHGYRKRTMSAILSFPWTSRRLLIIGGIESGLIEYDILIYTVLPENWTFQITWTILFCHNWDADNSTPTNQILMSNTLPKVTYS